MSKQYRAVKSSELLYNRIILFTITEFISWIFHLVDKTIDLLLMSHGLNHERGLLPARPNSMVILNFVSLLKPHGQKGYQLRKKFCARVLISVT